MIEASAGKFPRISYVQRYLDSGNVSELVSVEGLCHVEAFQCWGAMSSSVQEQKPSHRDRERERKRWGRELGTKEVDVEIAETKSKSSKSGMSNARQNMPELH